MAAGAVRSTNATLLTVNMTVVDDIFPSVELEFRRHAARRVIATDDRRMIANSAAEGNTRSMGLYSI